MVSSADVDVEVYELLEQVDRLRRRVKSQAANIGLLVRLLKLQGGKLHGDRLPEGETKSALRRAVASATGLLSLGTALKIEGALPCGTLPEHAHVEDLLPIVHEVCVSSTARTIRRDRP